MQWKVIIAVLFLLLHVEVADATIMYVPQSLEDSIADATVVAQVRIRSIEQRRFREDDRSATCGTDYVVDVLTTFKGEPRSQRTFSGHEQPHAVLYHEVKPGDELLVLLTRRQRGQGPEGGITDVIRSAPSRAEIECRAQLSVMTLLDGEARGFPLIARAKTSGQKDVVWIAYSVAHTEMPKSLLHDGVLYDANCTGLECTRAARRMVPWEPLQAEIQRWVAPGKGQ